MNRLGMIGFAGLFSGTFWQGFRYQTPQAIEDELKKDVPSLKVLLNEEDIIQEVKNGSNQKLQDFLAKNLNELVDLITVMPEADEHERGHKFPFVVSEILNCDCASILDAFFNPPKEEELVPQPKEEMWPVKKDDHDEDEDEDLNKHYDEDDNGPLVVKDDKTLPELPDDPPHTEDAATQPEEPEEDQEHSEPPKPEPAAEAPEPEKPAEPEAPAEEEAPKEQQQQAAAAPAEKPEVEAEAEGAPEEEAKEEEPKQIGKEPEQEENDAAQEGQDGLFEEEEKTAVTMTQDSTTCETRERSKYESIDRLFEFVAPARPGSSASLASEATAVSAAEDLTADELNPVLCGYFAKLVMHFVVKRPKEFFLYISERPRALHNMAKHVYSRAIADSLIRVLTCENHGLEDSSTFGDYNELRNSVVEEVLTSFQEAQAPWTLQNAANIICELSMRRPFFDVLATPAYMKLVLGPMFSELPEKRLASVRRQCMRIMSMLLAQYKANLLKDANKDEEKKDEDGTRDSKSPGNFGDDDDVIIGDEEESPEKKAPPKEPVEEAKEEPQAAPAEEEPPVVQEPSPFIETLNEWLDKIITLLELEPERATDTITGLEMQPFGAARLSVVEMLGDILKLNEEKLSDKIIASNVMKKLVQFFGKYEWNSLLHFKLDLIFSEILRTQEPKLMTALFEQAHFLNYVTQLVRSEDFQLKNETGRRIERGFYPYLIRFLDNLETMREKNEYVDSQIKAFGEEEWKEVWDTKVTPKKTKYAKQLGGHHPNQKGPIKKDEDLLTGSISNKFTSYQGSKEKSEEEPEEDIPNKREEDDDEDDDDIGAGRRNMLGSIDKSTDKHRNLYIQTTSQEEEDDKGFQAWNVDDPENELSKDQAAEKKGPGLTMEELSNEFDFSREEQEDRFGDFDSQRATAGGFSAGDFGDFQSGEEFFDAQGPEEEPKEVGANEDEDFNDFNYWKVNQGYDLGKLMSEM